MRKQRQMCKGIYGFISDASSHGSMGRKKIVKGDLNKGDRETKAEMKMKKDSEAPADFKQAMDVESLLNPVRIQKGKTIFSLPAFPGPAILFHEV